MFVCFVGYVEQTQNLLPAAGEVLVTVWISLPTLSPHTLRLTVGETERNPDRARDLPRVIQVLCGFQVTRLLAGFGLPVTSLHWRMAGQLRGLDSGCLGSPMAGLMSFGLFPGGGWAPQLLRDRWVG